MNKINDYFKTAEKREIQSSGQHFKRENNTLKRIMKNKDSDPKNLLKMYSTVEGIFGDIMVEMDRKASNMSMDKLLEEEMSLFCFHIEDTSSILKALDLNISSEKQHEIINNSSDQKREGIPSFKRDVCKRRSYLIPIGDRTSRKSLKIH